MRSDSDSGEARGWLRALGLHRKEIRAWAMYDWANSAFATTVMAAVLPTYYAAAPAAELEPHIRSAYWGYTTSIALFLIAIISPVLGASADYLGAKKRFLAFFAGLGVVFTSFLYFAGPGDWMFASAVFIVANIGFAGANVFYESLLPSLASAEEIDRVSTAGYATGYVGGSLLLAVNLAWILSPETFGLADAAAASRLSFVSVAIWWAVFSIPLFQRVPEPPRRLEDGEASGINPVLVGFARVVETLMEIRKHKQVFWFLLAFWFYNDGIGSIIKMATTFGAEIGIGQSDLVAAILITNIAGIPFTFAYGLLADRIGTKNGIILGCGIYTLISTAGYFIQTAAHFYVLAFAVAMVQGGTQALSRSLFASIVPAGKSSQFFGFFSVSAKFAGILGPLTFAWVTQLTGQGRLGIVALIIFFVVGIAFLTRVDVEEGRAVARAEDAEMHTA